MTAAGSVVALVTAFLHLTPTTAGYLAAIATGLGVLVTGFKARPVSLTVITGAAGVILQGMAVFGLHLSSTQTGALIAGVNLVLGYVLHMLLIPTVAAPAKK